MRKFILISLVIASIANAQTWEWQNPLPQGNILQAVDFVDSQNGWASGWSGTVIHTSNGGATWTMQVSGTTNHLYGVDFTDASSGWAVGGFGHGSVLHTTDGGSNWVLGGSWNTNDLYGVAFVDAERGWIVGAGGLIRRTTNGGNSWELQVSGTTNALRDIFFVDANTGWAVGDGGTIRYTTNGGSTWVTQNSTTTNNLRSVDFVDANNGWAVGENGTIRRTTNGGTTWVAQGSTSDNLYAVEFANANTGWAVGSVASGSSGRLHRTTNGGTTWTAQSNGTVSLFAVSFPNVSSGWAVGIDGRIIRTTNGGSTWTAQSSGITTPLFSVAFADAENGWVVGGAGTIRHTTNGGATWTGQSSGTTDLLFDVACTDLNNAWAVGNSGTIRRTTNSGSTWITQSSNTTASLYSVAFANPQNGWAVGASGTIRHTIDGGISWDSQASGTTLTLTRVTCTSDQKAWIVGYLGTVLHTSDGGNSWTIQNASTSANLSDVSFVNDSTGWLVGNSGTVRHTTTGGNSWLSQSVGVNWSLSAVDFIDENVGWVNTGTATLRRTINGGASWPQVQQVSGTIVEDIKFINTGCGWAVGYSGQILHYELLPSLQVENPNGGETWTSNTAKTITWIPIGCVSSVHIHIYKGSPPHGTFLQAITTSTPNTGSYEWTVFPWLQPGSDYYIGIAETDDDPWDYSDAPFTISAPSLGYISGVVTNTSNQPIDQASISLPSLSAQTTTNAQGNFQFNAIPPGNYVITASKAGYVSTSSSISVGAGSVTNVDLTLNGEIAVVLTVLDEHGDPVTNAGVHTIGYTEMQTTTDSLGLCTLRVVEGSYQLSLSAAGFMDRTTNPISFAGSRTESHTENMFRAQAVTPTYIFLIRGISFLPSGPDDGEWDVFLDSVSARYPDGSVIAYPITIDPVNSLDYNANLLANEINSNNFGVPNPHIILVGHSMGGIIARKYLANTRDERVKKLFTIDSPHTGSGWAELGDQLWNGDAFPKPFPAYSQMTRQGMIAQNALMLQHERNLNTQYYLLSTKRQVYLEAEGLLVEHNTDGVVSFKSQQGVFCSWFRCSNIFEDFRNEALQDEFHRRSDSGECHTPFVHICQDSDPNVIAYILDHLNTTSEEVANDPPLTSMPSVPDAQILWSKVGMLHIGESHTDTIPVPSAAYLEVSSLGLPVGSQWALESPDGIVLADSADFDSAGGVLIVDDLTQYVEATLLSPVAGNWILHLQLLGSDSAQVVVSASAPTPVLVEPIQPLTAISPDESFLINALAPTVPGVTIDSVTSSIWGDSIIHHLNDSGANGDLVAGDSLWSASYSVSESGRYPVELIAYAHAGAEQYRVQGSMEIIVATIIASLDGQVTWQAMNSDLDTLFESLEAAVIVGVDSASVFRLSATLTDSNGDFISAAFAEDTLPVGYHEVSLSFEGKHIADHRENGPFVLRDVRLDRISSSSVTLQYQDSLAASPFYAYSSFEGRPDLVENVGAVRFGSTMECFWTPHSDSDIAHFKLYYDTDGLPPYDGTGLNEGSSPINVGNTLAFTASGADSSLSYTFSLTAVDSSGSESEYSLPYTVFAIGQPVPPDSVTILVDGDEYVISWVAVSGGARYLIQTASTPDGPWTAVAQTFATTYRRPLAVAPEFTFFRIIATR